MSRVGIRPANHISWSEQNNFFNASNIPSQHKVYNFGTAKWVSLQNKACFAECFQVVYCALYVVNALAKYLKTTASVFPAVILTKIADNATPPLPFTAGEPTETAFSLKIKKSAG